MFCFTGSGYTLLGAKIPMLDSSDSEEEKPITRKRPKLGINNEVWSTGESDEETVESAFAKKFKKNTFVPIDGENSQYDDMSPPPSPFLSLSNIDADDNLPLSALQRMKQKLQAELEKVSDESNGVSPIVRRRKKGTKKVGNISASPLSAEDPSEISLPPNPPLPTDLPPLPPEDAPLPNEPTLMPAQHYPGYWPASAAVPYPPYMWNQNVEPHLHPYYNPQEFDPYRLPPDNSMFEPCSEEESDEEVTPLEVSKLVMDRIFEELKNTLFKDFHRRLLENEAYKKFETWCQKREEYHKASTKQQQEAKSNVTEANQPKPTPMNDIKDAIAYGGSIFGGTLGIRCSIPKLPSFRIRKELPPPVNEYSSKSYDDSESDRTSSSEEEAEEEEEDEDEDVNAKTPRSKKTLRKLSFSSDASASSSSSVSSSDSSSSSDESDLEDETRLHKVVERNASASPISPPSDSRDSFNDVLQKGLKSSKMEPDSDQENKITEEMEERMSQSKIDKLMSSSFEKGEQRGFDEKIRIKKEEEPLDTSHLIDHNYSRPTSEEEAALSRQRKLNEAKALQRKKPVKTRHQRTFKLRDNEDKTRILYDLFYSCLDEEDVEGLRLAFEDSLAFDSNTYWLNSTHWVEYPATAPQPKRSKDPDTRVHKSGSARTEGLYQLTKSEKAANRRQWGVVTEAANECVGHVGALSTEKANSKMQVAISREARSNQRRLLTALGNEVDSDLLKFNQLKFRKKSLRFGRSTIHDWGLFASEAIAADEMVIEYVGQMIRPVIADLRERKYMAIGIGSSYLFRIDLETIIDATRCGNLSRFINHSCNVSYCFL